MSTTRRLLLSALGFALVTPLACSSNPQEPMQGPTSDAAPAVTSQDGTRIAYESTGSGPALVLVGGGLTDRSSDATLASTLANSFTVYTYDRRRRGDSGDTQPYAVEREIEDLEAVIAAAGGSAYVMGQSSGAVLTLRAAVHGLPITKLALYEPPVIVDATVREVVPADLVEQLTSLVAANRLFDATALFLTKGVGLPVEEVTPIKDSPMWPELERLAPATIYDAAITIENMTGKPLPAAWAGMASPTIVIDGDQTWPWLNTAADEVAKVLPNAERRTLAGQTHFPEDAAIAPVLTEFFK